MTDDFGSRVSRAFDAYADQLYPTDGPVWSPPPIEPRWTRRWAAPIAAALVAAALISGVVLLRWQTDRSTPAASEMSETVRDKLASVARNWADSNGDQGPVTADAVSSTSSRAEQYLESGSAAGGADPVWVVQLHGDFVCGECKIPSGATTPTGRLITLVLDAQSLTESQYSVGDTEPDLSTLGVPVPLPVPAVSAAVREALSASARQQAAAAHPAGSVTAAAVLVTSIQAATAITGPGLTAAGRVWLIDIRGDFRCDAGCFNPDPPSILGFGRGVKPRCPCAARESELLRNRFWLSRRASGECNYLMSIRCG